MTRQPGGFSPLTAKLYELDYPRSLGVYSTYEEVQAVVDTLADHEFPVQRTMIVGTDLKLVERVTGRRTWGRTLGSGALSGMWLGMFLGLMFMLLTDQGPLIILTNAVMGALFFMVWSAAGYAASRGRRDFTSMTATIPMQYELMVEHSDVARARDILIAAGAIAPDPSPVSPSRPSSPNRPSYGLPSAPRSPGSPSETASGASAHRPSYGLPTQDRSSGSTRTASPHDSSER